MTEHTSNIEWRLQVGIEGLSQRTPDSRTRPNYQAVLLEDQKGSERGFIRVSLVHPADEG